MTLTIRRLDELCLRITDGKHGDCDADNASGYFFLSAKDIKDGSLMYDGARQITFSGFQDSHKRTRLEPNDILCTNSGSLGRLALVPDNALTRRTTFQKSVAILKPNPEAIVPKYLYYVLMGNIDRLVGLGSGTAQKNLLLCDIRNFSLAVPGRLSQRKTAALLAAYDDLIENNQRRIRILEDMAQAIYREWFVEFRYPGHESVRLIHHIGVGVPLGWTMGSVGDLAYEVRKSINIADVDADTPCVGLEHIPRKSLSMTEWGRAADVQSSKLKFDKGDILFGKIRPYFHKVAVAPINGICSSDAIVIKSRQPEYFGLALSCIFGEDFVNHATQTSQGTKMPRSNWEIMAKFPVAIPGEILLGRFNNTISALVADIVNMGNRNRVLRQTRDLLLPKLISGDVDVSDLDVSTEDLR